MEESSPNQRIEEERRQKEEEEQRKPLTFQKTQTPERDSNELSATTKQETQGKHVDTLG